MRMRSCSDSTNHETDPHSEPRSPLSPAPGGDRFPTVRTCLVPFQRDRIHSPLQIGTSSGGEVLGISALIRARADRQPSRDL
jgi:hypothetical protein